MRRSPKPFYLLTSCRSRGPPSPVIFNSLYTGQLPVATVNAPTKLRGRGPVKMMWSYLSRLEKSTKSASQLQASTGGLLTCATASFEMPFSSMSCTACRLKLSSTLVYGHIVTCSKQTPTSSSSSNVSSRPGRINASNNLVISPMLSHTKLVDFHQTQ